MKKFFVIFASCVLFLSSCLSEILDGRKESSGFSDIVLSLSSKAQTKAGGAKDGDKMSNLHIWLVKGDEVKGYLSQKDADLSIAADGTTATATFKNVERGACTLYLVANLPANCDLPSKYTVNSAIDSDFLKYVLPAVDENTHEPPYGDTTPGMPLSTTLNMSVGAGTNRVSAELVRCCAKITLTIRNNTLNNTIILKDLAFSNCNPNNGYLFQQGDYSISASSFGPFKDFNVPKNSSTDKHILHGFEEIYLQQYMYENINAGADTLGFHISGALFPEEVTSAEVRDVVTGSGGTRTVYSLGTSNPEKTIPTATPCLIKSRDYNSYLYDDNGTLKAGTPNTSDIDLAYLWTFTTSGTNTVSIRNFKSPKRYISLTTDGDLSMVETSSSFYYNYTSSTAPFRFYNGTSSKIYNNYYWVYAYTLWIDSTNSVGNTTESKVVNGKTITPSTNDDCYFNIYKVTSQEVTLPSTTEEKLVATDGSAASVYFDKTISSLNYINKYGTPVPLEQIYRNQDVQIVVNIHYNPNSGVLFFETSNWVNESDNDTTFD